MPSQTAVIRSITFEKVFFTPGEPVRWTIELHADQPFTGQIITEIRSLDVVANRFTQLVSFGPGEWQAELAWNAPEDAPQGYGMEITLQKDRQTIAQVSSAFDVLEKWTQNPRYGFLTDFYPGRSDGSAALDTLANYRINGLQFYDWMYRHEQYLSDQEPYTDLLGRQLSLETVQQLIELAHQRGMAAMPYTAVYGASMGFYRQHPDWALLEPDGKPHLFGDNFLVIMDPRPESPWTAHLLDQFDQILKRTNFDGIHLDQYGAPKAGYTASGEKYTLDQPLADLINATAGVVQTDRSDAGTVVFNAVTNWPIETVAPSQEDLVYIEVWTPYDSFNDLAALVKQGQQLGSGKPVVIAAYVHVDEAVNVILNDAIIFASGGSHIEMGENGGYLADPYFPKYEQPSAELAARLQRYYLFSLRYQNILGPATQDGAAGRFAALSLPGYETSANVSKDKIMPLIRSSQSATAISLVNLLGLPHGEWAKGLVNAPTAQKDLTLKLSAPAGRLNAAWFATPDGEDLRLRPADFEQSADTLTVQVPSLDYWSLILLDWSE